MDDSECDAPSHPLLRAFQQKPSIPKPISVAVKCLLGGVHVASITIGAIYFHDCPGQFLIPYYLIISGALGILFLTLTCLPCGDGQEPPRSSLATIIVKGVMSVFVFAFFIAGNVWIYSLYNENWDSPTSPQWCHRVLFLYAFWSTTVYYMCLAFLLCVYLCLLLTLCIVRQWLLPSQ